MATQSLTIEQVPIDKLRLNPANPRLNDEAVPHVIASIQRFGWQQPIVALPSGEVIAGNTRLKAAQKMGLTEVPVVWFEGSDLDATAFAIADNRTHEFAKWDEPALAQLLQHLHAEDSLAGVGYGETDLQELLDRLAEAEGGVTEIDDPGPGEPPETPVSRPGDLWLLGDHRLLCGDSTQGADVARVLAGETAALLSTDPPYCVNYTGMDRPIHDGKPSGKDWSHVYKEVEIEDLGEFLDAVFTACLPHVAERTAIYIWHAHLQQPIIASTFEKHGLLLHQVLVWVKPVATFGHSYYRWKHEPCAFGWRQGFKPEHGLGQLESVLECDWEGKSRVVGNEHPCLHPDSLVLTDAGWRPIRGMQVGDRVFAADGEFHAVTDVTSHPYTSPDLFRIVARGSNVPTLASDNHPFLVWRPQRQRRSIVGGDVAWARADELRVGDHTMTPVMEGRRAQCRYIEHEGREHQLRRIKNIERVPYAGDVWNLSVDGCPSFQTSVGMSHNTQKPLRLFEIPMEQHTKRGDPVLEPFSGSGSQILAAERLGRRCRALEIEPAFVDVAVERWQRATGKTAVLEETGEGFEETRKQRLGE